MTSFTWTGTAGGDWSNGADWNQNIVPNGTTADATLGVTGTYTVTISSSDPTYTVDSLTLNDPGVTFVEAGTLALSGTQALLALDAGSFDLTGTVQGGTINQAGGSLIVGSPATFGSSATLDGVTLLGPLNVTAGGATLYVKGGLTVETAAGGLSGSINITGEVTDVVFLDTETIDSVAINIGSDQLFGEPSDIDESAGATLTFGTQAVITISAPGAYPRTANDVHFSGGTFVNRGVINAGTGDIYIETSFRNLGTIITSSGDQFNTTFGVFDNFGVIVVGSTTTFDIGQYFSNGGTIRLAGGIFAGGTLTDSGLIVGTGTIGSLAILSGTIEAQGGRLTVSQVVQSPPNVYTGLLQIDAGATLELGDGSGPGIHFNGAGATLQLDAPAANTGTFTGLAAGDTLVLQGVTATDAHSAGNLLTIDLAGGTTLEYSLAAPLTGLVETTGTTAAGSEVSFLIPCFLRGTLIATTTGDIAVENLRVGDHVITAAGTARPIRWLGHRAVDCTNIPDPQAAWPVLVRQGAFGEAMPVRDLWLSPEHCIATQDALIPARVLQNGRTIVQVARPAVEYWHVELDSHDVILAEGLPVETFLDNGNRYAFEGGADYAARHPELSPKHWTETCRPLLLEGEAVAAAKSHLLRRAAALGHAITGDADLHMLADGQRLAPLWLSESRAAFVLGAGCREIALQSRCFVPAHLDGATADWRSLGVCVARLQIDGSEIDLADDAAFRAGWHRLEDDGAGYRQRWTSGGARLPAQARLVVLDIAGPGFYWIDEPLAVVPAATGPWAWVTARR